MSQGSKTPNSEYKIPILQVLTDFGGRGKVKEILERVYEKMKDVLNSFDLEVLSSGFDVRWRNAAQWARNSLVRDGLMKSDSPRGVWEISEAGRQWLAKSSRARAK